MRQPVGANSNFVEADDRPGRIQDDPAGLSAPIYGRSACAEGYVWPGDQAAGRNSAHHQPKSFVKKFSTWQLFWSNLQASPSRRAVVEYDGPENPWLYCSMPMEHLEDDVDQAYAKTGIASHLRQRPGHDHGSVQERRGYSHATPPRPSRNAPACRLSCIDFRRCCGWRSARDSLRWRAHRHRSAMATRLRAHPAPA